MNQRRILTCYRSYYFEASTLLFRIAEHLSIQTENLNEKYLNPDGVININHL
ncbi:MAG: hypothetical protein L3J66_13225 [Bacteroidales bacterium]|nr:hypothetical protein [Bacteroidales bacterium]